jgi:ribosome-associated heat shock protein Hsp15
MVEPAGPPERVRVDVWLDVVCLFRTRSEAQRACQGGKVEVNGQRVKPHRELKEGDELTISRPPGRRQCVVVRGLSERHLPKAEARLLYEDVTPPPTPEELELRQMAALARPLRPASGGAPSKRQRRDIRKLKGLDR